MKNGPLHEKKIEVDRDKELIMLRAIGMLHILFLFCIYDMVMKEQNCFFFMNGLNY